MKLIITIVAGSLLLSICAIAQPHGRGIGFGKYSKYKTRDKLVRDLAAMDPQRREKILSRLQPDLQMEIRQELMKRFRLKTDI